MLFVVDSSDKERLNEAKEHLFYLLDEDELWGVPLLVMANKQDRPNALSPHYIAENLGLNAIRNRKWCKLILLYSSTIVGTTYSKYLEPSDVGKGCSLDNVRNLD